MTPRPPPDARWNDDGFSVNLGQLRCRHGRPRSHVWALTIPLYLVALYVELSSTGSAFVLGTALVLFARQAMWFDERQLTVGSWGLSVGRRRIGAHALRSCELRGNSLVLRTTKGTWALGVGGLAQDERCWLRDEIGAVARRWRARQGEVPPQLRRVTRAIAER